MDFNQAQQVLLRRAEQLRGVYEVFGRSGLKEYSRNDVGIFGSAVTNEIQRLSDKIGRGEGT